MKRFVWLLLIVLSVAGVWSAGWFFAAGQVQQALAMLEASDGVSGPQLTCAQSSVSGFPFRIDIACEEAVLVLEDTTFAAGGVRVSVQADNPTHVLFSARSPITTDDAFYGQSTRLAFAQFQGSARIVAADLLKGFSGQGWRIARVSLVGDGLDWVDTTAAESPVARAAHAELQLIDIPERHDKAAGRSSLAIYVVAKDVVAPTYGVGNGQVEIQAELDGLPDDLHRFADADAVARWSAAGGKVKLVDLTGTDGNDLLQASGTLGLDADHAPEGDVTFVTRGIRERLVPFMDPMSLAILAGMPQADGTFKQALQFSGGSARVGGIPLFATPPLF